MNIVLLGPPGSGKGTQAKLLAETFGLFHMSTGDILRRYAEQDTELGRTVKDYLSKGIFVTKEIISEILSDFLKNNREIKGLLLDGIPRNLEQAKIVDEMLQSLGKKIDLAIGIEVSENVIISRIINRLVCPKCGSVYNLIVKAPKKLNVCDNCGTGLTIRSDDNEAVVKNRMAVYNSETMPLINLYKSRGIYKEIDGSKSVEEVSQILKDNLLEWVKSK